MESCDINKANVIDIFKWSGGHASVWHQLTMCSECKDRKGAGACNHRIIRSSEVNKPLRVASGWSKKCPPASTSWEIFNTIPFSTYWNCRQKLCVHVCVCLGRPCVSEQRPCVCERGEDLLLLLLLRKSFSASTAAKYSKQEVLSSCLSTKKNRLQYLYPLVTGSKIPRHD